MHRIGLYTLILVIAGVAAYHRLPTFSYFQLDDPVHLQRNPKMDPVSTKNILSFWTTPYENAYMPVSYTVWSFVAPFARRSVPHEEHGKFFAQPFHGLSLFFHILVACLLLRVLHRYTGSEVASLFGALIFLLHPAQVETVSWITGLRGLLVGFFSMLCLLRYDDFVRPKKGEPQKSHYYWAMFFYLFATLAKPTAYALVGMIAVLEVWFHRRSLKAVLRQLAPWLIVPAVLAPVHLNLNNGVASLAVQQYPGFERLFLMADSYVFYLKQFFFPIFYVVDYGKTVPGVLASSESRYALLFLMALGIGLYVNRKKDLPRAVGCALCVMLVGLLPVSGVTRFIFQHIATVSDRYMYLSMIAPAFLVAWLLSRFPQGKILVGGIALFLAYKTTIQVNVWENYLSLYGHNYKYVKSSWLICNNLANAHEKAGNRKMALKYYQEATKHADYPAIWNNVGALGVATGNIDVALRAFARVLKAMPRAAEAHNNMGVAWAKAGRLDIAKNYFERAKQIDPGMAKLQQNMTTVRLKGVKG